MSTEDICARCSHLRRNHNAAGCGHVSTIHGDAGDVPRVNCCVCTQFKESIVGLAVKVAQQALTPPSPVETYEKFMDRCEVFFPHATCVQISVAYALSKHYHRHDVRKSETDANGNPVRYFEHPRRVALIFLDELVLPDPELIMVALLHDAIEDTRLAPEAVTLVCGDQVSKRVMLLSKKPKEGYHQRLIMLGDWKTLMVKCADRLDNLRHLGGDQAFVEKQVRETERMYYSIADQMCRLARNQEFVGEPHPITTAADSLRTWLHRCNEKVAAQYGIKLQ